MRPLQWCRSLFILKLLVANAAFCHELAIGYCRDFGFYCVLYVSMLSSFHTGWIWRRVVMVGTGAEKREL